MFKTTKKRTNSKPAKRTATTRKPAKPAPKAHKASSAAKPVKRPTKAKTPVKTARKFVGGNLNHGKGIIAKDGSELTVRGNTRDGYTVRVVGVDAKKHFKTASEANKFLNETFIIP